MKLAFPKIKLLLFTIGTLISILIILFLFYITEKQIGGILKSSDKLLHSNAIELELEKLSTQVEYTETSQSAYLLTHDASFLVPYYQSWYDIDISLTKLGSLLSTDKIQSIRLVFLKKTINQRHQLMQHAIDIEVASSKRVTSETSGIKTEQDSQLVHRPLDLISEMKNYQDMMFQVQRLNHRRYVSGTPIRNLGFTLFTLLVFSYFFIKINRDRKKLRKVNNEMRIINQTYARAEKLADLSNWRLNLKDMTTLYSDNFYSLMGYKPHEIEPTIKQYLKFVHSEDRDLVFTSLKNAFRYYLSFNISYRIYTKSHELRHFKSIGQLITDNKKHKYVIGINVDETELLQSQAMLELKNKKLELSNADLASFNYVASHDLQAPLRKIQMLISRIKEVDYPNMSIQGRDYFSRILTSTTHMHTLINDLLMFSRANASNKKFEVANLNELLSNALDDLVMVIDEKKATIQCGALPNAKVIPYQIQQLFTNLISNSLKFNNEGIAPVIKIESKLESADNLQIENSYNTLSYHRISFIDNGIGFEKQYAKKIFQLSFRLHDKSQYPGTGIGLSICKKIVENHNGFIETESSPLHGASFSIYLPAELT